MDPFHIPQGILMCFASALLFRGKNTVIGKLEEHGRKLLVLHCLIVDIRVVGMCILLRVLSNHKTKPSFALIRKYAFLCAIHDHNMFRPS
jgi:hypothetical protein